MRRFCSGIVGLALACLIAGCGDSTVEEGTVEYKSTDTSQFAGLQKSMMESMKSSTYKTKPAVTKDAKPAEKKP